MDTFLTGTSLTSSSFEALSPDELRKALTPPKNGGWFTGESFKKGAGWGSVDVVPTTDYMIHENLKSVEPAPHPAAFVSYPHYVRKGNNYQENIGLQQPSRDSSTTYACPKIKDGRC